MEYSDLSDMSPEEVAKRFRPKEVGRDVPEMPWWLFWLRWLRPYRAKESRHLVECECGRVMYLDAPQWLRGLHAGHIMRNRVKGSFGYFVKAKLGRLDKPTFTEWLVLRAERNQAK